MVVTSADADEAVEGEDGGEIMTVGAEGEGVLRPEQKPVTASLPLAEGRDFP